MPDTSPLRAAPPGEVTEALAFAVSYEGRKCLHHADDIMARIAAERLVRHLVRSGFVVMKRPPAPSPTAPYPPHGRNAGIRTWPVTRDGNTC